MTSAEVEKLGIEMASPLLEHWAGGMPESIIDTNKMEYRVHRQRTLGDFIIKEFSDGLTACFELKTEEAFTGNAFIETWSNRTPRRRDDGTPLARRGWIETLETDYIVFAFLDVKCAFRVPFKPLQKWFVYDFNCSNYREVLVRRSWEGEQKNKTWGCPVPFKDLLGPVGVSCWAFIDGEWAEVQLEHFSRQRQLNRA